MVNNHGTGWPVSGASGAGRSIEFVECVFEEVAKVFGGKQAEREFPIGQHMIGVELSIKMLEFSVEGLACSDGVSSEFPIQATKLLIAFPASLSCGG